MSTETKSTPGPWTLEYAPVVGQIRVVHQSDGLRSCVAQLLDIKLCEAHGTVEANALLIAAAPELLEGLTRIINGGNVDCGSYWQVDVDDISFARAALKKAKGQP